MPHFLKKIAFLRQEGKKRGFYCCNLVIFSNYKPKVTVSKMLQASIMQLIVSRKRLVMGRTPFY